MFVLVKQHTGFYKESLDPSNTFVSLLQMLQNIQNTY